MRTIYKQLSRRDLLRLVFFSVGAAIISACQRAVSPGAGASAEPTQTPNVKGAPPSSSPTIVNGVPVTANDDFYTVWYSSGPVPRPPANWQLAIGGLVERPLSLTLDEIKAMPSVTAMRTLECISNPVGGELISNGIWKGVRLKDLLAQAQVKSNAQYLKLESFDGYDTGIPLELAMDDHALLVYEMNGAPLPGEHGAPLRCLWPGRYGMKQPKWIQTITLVDKEYRGYWEKQGWSNDAIIQPNSRIDTPKDLEVIAPPTFAVSGIAYTDDSGLAKLEIGWDDLNEWKEAELTRGPSPLVWTLWRWTGPTLSPGRHTLYARATDNRGHAQTRGQVISLLGGTFPDGTDQMHSIVLEFKNP